jgi:hypothetical protein
MPRVPLKNHPGASRTTTVVTPDGRFTMAVGPYDTISTLLRLISAAGDFPADEYRLELDGACDKRLISLHSP